MAFGVYADERVSVAFDGEAPYAVPDVIADNVRTECNLPAYQGAAFERAAEAAGIQIERKSTKDLAGAPRAIRLQILNALSAGNAFMGHRKQVTLTAKLFREGAEVSTFKATRESMGGIAAGFKGSCAVLERCADTLGEDLARWLKGQSAIVGPDGDSKKSPLPAVEAETTAGTPL